MFLILFFLSFFFFLFFFLFFSLFSFLFFLSFLLFFIFCSSSSMKVNTKIMVHSTLNNSSTPKQAADTKEGTQARDNNTTTKGTLTQHNKIINNKGTNNNRITTRRMKPHLALVGIIIHPFFLFAALKTCKFTPFPLQETATSAGTPPTWIWRLNKEIHTPPTTSNKETMTLVA